MSLSEWNGLGIPLTPKQILVTTNYSNNTSQILTGEDLAVFCSASLLGPKSESGDEKYVKTFAARSSRRRLGQQLHKKFRIIRQTRRETRLLAQAPSVIHDQQYRREKNLISIGLLKINSAHFPWL